MSAKIPDEYLCPISYDIMDDPVTLEDGTTYNRSSLVEWFKKSSVSPMTNRPVDTSRITPNYALRAAIERWKVETAAGGGTAAGGAKVVAEPVRTFRARATQGGAVVLECEETAAAPLAVIVGLDRSGSMSEPSARPGSKASSEGNLLSRMDLLKHAMRVIIGMLASKKAALGICSFSDTATVNLPVRTMDKAGKGEAEKVLHNLAPGGGTHIWAGMKTCLEQAVSYAEANPTTNVQVWLLTDGEPTESYSPLHGIDGAFQRRMSKLGARVTVSTFGFGYNLDAKLLNTLCTTGAGVYGYIPDCSLAGSVFINACAAALATVVSHVRVNGALVGSIQAGMTRVVAPPGGVRAGDEVEIQYGASGATTKVVAGAATNDEDANALVLLRLQRDLAAASRSRTYGDNDWSGLQAMKDWIGDHDGGFRSAVMADLESTDDNRGQLLKAVRSREWFDAWGLNHLLAYSRAIACQQCTNFKDQALQFFAGDAFKVHQDVGNDLFDTLPAPVPSLNSWYGGGYGGGGGAGPAINMAALNNAGGGCFAGNALVEMADNTRKHVSQLRSGDIVRGGHRIVCVVRTPLTRRPRMVTLPGLTITPWHPVRLAEGSWKFPAELGEPVEIALTAYYNLVLESGHTVRIGNYDVCTLGHGFTENYVIRHPYFGTQAVLDDLRRLPGWEEGLVELREGCSRRSNETGLICGL